MSENSGQEYEQNSTVKERDIPVSKHYHGEKVRQLFFVIGIVMILGFPIFSAYINVGGFIAVLGILIVAFFGGMTSPRRKSVMFSNLIISIIGTGVFEQIAFYRFNTVGHFFDGYFWFNEIIALLFFAALYFSTKTFRKMSLESEN